MATKSTYRCRILANDETNGFIGDVCDLSGCRVASFGTRKPTDHTSAPHWGMSHYELREHWAHPHDSGLTSKLIEERLIAADEVVLPAIWPGPWSWRDAQMSDGKTCAVFLQAENLHRFRDPTVFALRDDWIGGLSPEREAARDLIIEAGNVAHETGLTPRQLADQRETLLRALQQIVAGKGSAECNDNLEAYDAAIATAREALTEVGEQAKSAPMLVNTRKQNRGMRP